MIHVPGKSWAFHRMPKTGSTSLAAAIHAAYPNLNQADHSVSDPDPEVILNSRLVECDADSVCTIFRDPWHWVVSYWIHRTYHTGWKDQHWGCDQWGSEDLVEFANAVARHQWLDKLYAMYDKDTSWSIRYRYCLEAEVNQYLARYDEPTLVLNTRRDMEYGHNDEGRAQIAWCIRAGLNRYVRQGNREATRIYLEAA